MKKVLVVLLLAGLLTALSVGPAVAAQKNKRRLPGGLFAARNRRTYGPPAAS